MFNFKTSCFCIAFIVASLFQELLAATTTDYVDCDNGDWCSSDCVEQVSEDRLRCLSSICYDQFSNYTQLFVEIKKTVVQIRPI